MALVRRDLNPYVPLRARLIWAAIRGHAIAYKLTINNGVMTFTESNGLVANCTVNNGTDK